ELFRLNRYNYKVIDLAMIGGQPAYVLSFVPKPRRDRLKTSGHSNFRIERKNDILNSLQGTVYLSPDDLGIIRVLTQVKDPPESIWGVGRLYKMDAIIDQIKIDDVWALKELHLTADFSYFLGIKRIKNVVKVKLKNFRLKAP
ncbi:MAG: hypothetical protein AAB638_02580, partial [Patescibacteria group bacterium]